jgi:hypothetical protein
MAWFVSHGVSPARNSSTASDGTRRRLPMRTLRSCPVSTSSKAVERPTLRVSATCFISSSRRVACLFWSSMVIPVGLSWCAEIWSVPCTVRTNLACNSTNASATRILFV